MLGIEVFRTTGSRVTFLAGVECLWGLNKEPRSFTAALATTSLHTELGSKQLSDLNSNWSFWEARVENVRKAHKRVFFSLYYWLQIQTDGDSISLKIESRVCFITWTITLFHRCLFILLKPNRTSDPDCRMWKQRHKVRGRRHRLRPEHMTGCQAEVKAGQDHKTTHTKTGSCS